MITLDKTNIVHYLKTQIPDLPLEEPISVHVIGEGELDKELEGDGYCNYVYRVSDGKHSYIVKQAQAHLRRRGKLMDPSRNRYEYEIMKKRAEIVPEFVPKPYYGDFENNIFVMEDVSDLKIVRYQMIKDHQLPKLADQMAHYLAATHFYTSEYYLSREEFRNEMIHFMGTDLRILMENLVFLKIFGADGYDKSCGEDFEKYCEQVRYDEYLQLQRYELRHIFMTHAETLIHGDFHTSNLFADDSHMKVIDMEYTFAAPFAFDLGFLMGNVIFQFCSSAFRKYPTETARRQYLSYVLSLIEIFYRQYVNYFFVYWEKDAKSVYRQEDGYKEEVVLDILRQAVGFAACVNFSRVCGDMETADFDMIKDARLRTQAKYLSVDIDACLLRKWNQYESISEVIDDLIALMKKRVEFTLF